MTSISSQRPERRSSGVLTIGSNAGISSALRVSVRFLAALWFSLPIIMMIDEAAKVQFFLDVLLDSVFVDVAEMAGGDAHFFLEGRVEDLAVVVAAHLAYGFHLVVEMLRVTQ